MATLRRILMFCIICIPLTSASAYSALLDLGSITRDTDTGLEWLDLTDTRGLSYDDVSSYMDAGEEYDGWRWATRAEVRTFWESAGGSGPFTGYASGTENWVGSLQNLWGKTYLNVYWTGEFSVQTSIAMTADPSSTCPDCNLTVFISDNVNMSDSSLGDAAESLQLNEAYRWHAQIPIGHALVRPFDTPSQTVPEPGTGLLLALGMFAPLFLRKPAVPLRTNSALN